MYNLFPLSSLFRSAEKTSTFVKKDGVGNSLHISSKLLGCFEIQSKWNVMWTELVFTSVWSLKPVWVHFASLVKVLLFSTWRKAVATNSFTKKLHWNFSHIADSFLLESFKVYVATLLRKYFITIVFRMILWRSSKQP